jgi:cystathionine gamma-synthase
VTSRYPAAMQFDTRAIHDGQHPDPSTGAVTVPIYQTSTYVQEAVGKLKDGYDYSRTANPTRRALEHCIASLESAAHGFAFASGMAATTTVMHLVDPGDTVVSVNDVYGGTYRLFSKVYEPKGFRFRYLSADDFSDDPGAQLDGARLVWIETPTNPLLNVIDIEALAAATHAAGALLVVDNTFASPYLQRPIELGADIVVHSATKYLGGHSDLVSGVAVTSDDRLAERLAFLQNGLGAVAGPFDSWLVLRGLKTLPVRMRQHCENARAVAGFLGGHPGVQRVLYPGIPTHPGHEIATRQMRDYGGMISFLVDTPEHAVDLVARTRVWSLAESLGGVESLIETPAQMTHASTADAPFATPENLVRLSVGIESADDLIDDLDQALG